MTVCVISQPRFFPGLHYLHRMMLADVFVILDTVQYNPRHEENRAKLKTPNGTQWLTAPMQRTSRQQLICDTAVAYNQPWAKNAAKTLQTLYGKAPHYAEYAPQILDILHGGYQTLVDLDVASWQPTLRRLGIICEFVYASDLPIASQGSELLLDICCHVEADAYVSGAFGKEYLDLGAFAAAGIDVGFHEYTCQPYPQRFGDFVPYLSYLDRLFNVGLDQQTIFAGGEIQSLYPSPV